MRSIGILSLMCIGLISCKPQEERSSAAKAADVKPLVLQFQPTAEELEKGTRRQIVIHGTPAEDMEVSYRLKDWGVRDLEMVLGGEANEQSYLGEVKIKGIEGEKFALELDPPFDCAPLVDVEGPFTYELTLNGERVEGLSPPFGIPLNDERQFVQICKFRADRSGCCVIADYELEDHDEKHKAFVVHRVSSMEGWAVDPDGEAAESSPSSG